MHVLVLKNGGFCSFLVGEWVAGLESLKGKGFSIRSFSILLILCKLP